MNDGLAYAHGKHVIHLDVSPRNIIYVRNGEKFVLIDWGCAATGEEKVKGFYGTLPFAHAEVHKKANTQEWIPRAKHDKASLLFTLFALDAGTPVPWSGFNRRLDEDTGVLKKRRDDTKKFLTTFVEKNSISSLSFLTPSEEPTTTTTQQKRRRSLRNKKSKEKAIAHLLKELENA
jgi:serine/threonine protein kinase